MDNPRDISEQCQTDIDTGCSVKCQNGDYKIICYAQQIYPAPALKENTQRRQQYGEAGEQSRLVTWM